MKKGEEMKILITGAHGQLGKELERVLSRNHCVVGLGKQALDITNRSEVEDVISQIRPNVIVHAAAYTAVDQCEVDQKRAFEVNGLGAGYVAQAAQHHNARIMYISSDYVFDGLNQQPYEEADELNPLSTYGLSKWLGEKLVLQHSRSTIIRTSWLYGHDGKNFVKTMIERAKNGVETKVVNDQIGSPTYVNDLAEAISQLLDKRDGIYHVSNTGACSWHEFAAAIFEEMGADPEMVLPISTDQYPTLAVRPKYSVLRNSAIAQEQVRPLRHWKDALQEFIRKENNR